MDEGGGGQEWHRGPKPHRVNGQLPKGRMREKDDGGRGWGRNGARRGEGMGQG